MIVTINGCFIRPHSNDESGVSFLEMYPGFKRHVPLIERHYFVATMNRHLNKYNSSRAFIETRIIITIISNWVGVLY